MTAPGLDVTIITGMSGAGRSSAADVFEDLGFFVIDNLPPALIPKVVELAQGREEPRRFVLVVDVRSGAFMNDLEGALAELHAQGVLTRASVEEIAATPGVGPEVAKAVHDHLTGGANADAAPVLADRRVPA